MTHLRKRLCDNLTSPKLNQQKNDHKVSTDQTSMAKEVIRNLEAKINTKHQMDATRTAGDSDRYLFEISNDSQHNGDIYNLRKHQTDPARTSGGDADRVLYDNSYTYKHNDDTHHFKKDTYYPLRKSYCSPKATALPDTPMGKYHHPMRGTKAAAVDDCNGHCRFYETESVLGATCNGSEGSVKSQISSKTVVSRRSSHELRKIVESQCKIQDMIHETLKQMCNPGDVDTNMNASHCALREPASTMEFPLSVSHCKRCSDDLHPPHSSQKDVMTEIGKGDFIECRNTDTLTITVDDVVNSKVINPMIRKLQRMYLNNLKEEMSLMEDLERLPHKVNEVYKATIFKQKE